MIRGTGHRVCKGHSFLWLWSSGYSRQTDKWAVEQNITGDCRYHALSAVS